jgi:hypothetical protein
MEGTVYTMNLPCPGLYKFVKLFQFKLPHTISDIGSLTRTVARFLVLKVRGFVSDRESYWVISADEAFDVVYVSIFSDVYGPP